MRSSVVSLLLVSSFSLGVVACSGAGGGSDPTGDDGAIVDEDTGSVDPDGGTLDDVGIADASFDAPPGTDARPSADTSPPPGTDAAPPPATAAVSLVILPDDGKTTIVDAIKAATKSIHVEVYLLTETGVINALIAAKKAGRDVSVLLEKSPYPDTTANVSAHDTLVAAGVKVTWTSTLYPLTHSKLMILDGTKAWVMTLNLTMSGVMSNREYALVDSDPGDVAEAEAIFAADVAATAKPKLTGNLVVSPVNARTSLTTLIDGAKRTLDVEMEEVYDATVVMHLESAAARGVTVRLIAPGSPDTSTATVLTTLKGKGVQVRTLGSPDVHAKIIVADGARMYVGSINLTKESLDYNREVGAITDLASAVSRGATRIAGDFAKATPY